MSRSTARSGRRGVSVINDISNEVDLEMGQMVSLVCQLPTLFVQTPPLIFCFFHLCSLYFSLPCHSRARLNWYLVAREIEVQRWMNSPSGIEIFEHLVETELIRTLGYQSSVEIRFQIHKYISSVLYSVLYNIQSNSGNIFAFRCDEYNNECFVDENR